MAKMTSFQRNGQAVVDYAVTSQSMLGKVKGFHVNSESELPEDDWSDHMATIVTIDGVLLQQQETVPQEIMLQEEHPRTSGLDLLYEEVMQSRQTTEEALDSLYGHVYFVTSSDVLGLAWPESHGFGLAFVGFGLSRSQARPM